MRIGILGGTFDPPHKGHLYLGANFARALALDRVLVIPAAVPPHKADKKLTSDADRLEMCRLAFDDPVFEVTDLELRRAGKSYTVDTLALLKKDAPDDDFYLLIGSDMLLYFDQWYRWREIRKMCTLCSFSRSEDEDYDRLADYAGNVLGGGVLLLDQPPMEISSTEIRRRVRMGEDVDELLPGAVAEYIRERGLYREGNE
ncbi:MAG: nicotinate-nucleotide adenylyltransferase [Clostridia bacterium]|nr:nicotinate-nucleotide adenylyltransferase [Clostridia bacterium]